MSAAAPPSRRTPALPLILAAALAGATVSWFVPVALYELIVESVGLSELFGAFAAPLGLTARLLIALAAAIVSAILVAALFMNSTARPHPASRRGVSGGTQGNLTMASQAPEANDYRNEPRQGESRQREPQQGESGGWFRKIMANLPAPRRFADEGGIPPADSAPERKRLRSGGAIAREDAVRPRPIAAHAELGEPLPPVEPRASLASAIQRAPQPASPWSADAAESIEALTDRLARVLGRGSDFPPQPQPPEPEPEPEPPVEHSRAHDAERTELESARTAARLAVDEAEEAKARAERNVEEAREQARRSVEEAEAAVVRADERARDTRHRLSAIEGQLSALAAPSQPATSQPPTPQPAIAPSVQVAQQGAPAAPAEAEDDMDPALRDALRTLRRMTAQQ